MIKRIVLEHLSGLRQIGGILDIPPDMDLPKLLGYKTLTCRFKVSRPRYLLYEEFDPAISSPAPLGDGQNEANT